jgi:hypothetical protein
MQIIHRVVRTSQRQQLKYDLKLHASLRTDGLFLEGDKEAQNDRRQRNIIARMAAGPLLDPERTLVGGEILSWAKVVQITMWSLEV